MKLEPKITICFCYIYNILALKLKKLKSYLEEKLAIEFIKLKKSQTRKLILFVKNKNEFLGLWDNY